MKNKNNIEAEIRNPQNYFPIPMQNVRIEKMKEAKKKLPHLKLIDISDLQTHSYAISPCYKYISRIGLK